MSEEALYRSVGGRPVVEGSGDATWDFGWVPFERRGDAEHEAHAAAVAAMPRFAIAGDPRKMEDADRADLTKLWKHPLVVQALGYEYSGTHQLTGSCVGAGGGNAAASLNFREVIEAGDPEKIILPFYPYTYGRSRLHSGMRGRGEGSTGSGWAKAATTDGVIDNALDGLPKPNNSDALVWGESVEMTWSAGDRIEQKWLDEGRKHLIKTAAVLRNSDEARQALVNGYPITCASMYAFKASVQGDVLLGRKSGSWSHQMSIHAYWKHPTHGPIFWLMNQWGKGAHGTCPSGMPPGGAWITGADLDWICRTGEVYAFSLYDGYPSPDFDIPWIL